MKARDVDLLSLIRTIVAERPTYGYRRSTAPVNREFGRLGRLPANHQRVYRIMKHHALRLERHSGRRPGRVHGGMVMVMRSDLRWCSDALEFLPWNCEVARLSFAIDAFDSEVIASVGAAGAGISGSDIRDARWAAVERRSDGAVRPPHPIEHFPDTGSRDIAKPTRDFAEAFVKTVKRGCVLIKPLPERPPCSSRPSDGSSTTNGSVRNQPCACAPPSEFRRARQT